MKEHYCPVDKTVISYEGECNWCGEKDTITLAELRQTDLYKNVRGKLMKPEMSMKEEALKLADDLLHSEVMVLELEASRMIHRLVEELDNADTYIDYLKEQTQSLYKQMEYSDFLPVWKEFLGGSENVLNVQMVAHHFYNLGLQASPQTKPLSDKEIENIAFNFVYDDDELDIFAFAKAIEERHGIK